MSIEHDQLLEQQCVFYENYDEGKTASYSVFTSQFRADEPSSKITDYLLSETHAVGKSKAKFFRSFGLNETNAGQFAKGLVDIAQMETVVETTETVYGKKYVIDGQLKMPSGDMIHLRTVWIIETGDDIPRLVTAHPLD